jgi:glyoxylase-like metal-dependent hydrolase (beta-lactamase superfamily II)
MATSSDPKIWADTYIVPIYPAETGSDDPLKKLWSPTSVTLIHTAHEAVICDAPPNIAETEKLADWIESVIPHKKLRYFFPTHAHGDHFFGFPVLAKRFPGIQAIATQAVAGGITEQYGDAKYEGLWKKLLPNNQLPTEQVSAQVLPASGKFTLENDTVEFHAYDVPHGDTSANSFLHVPALNLIVAGDLVYGDCYQYLAEANTASKRAGWQSALDQIAALKPQVVIPGHPRASQVPGPWLIGSTKRYIEVWEEELEKAQSAEELEERMLELYPERWNRFILEMSVKGSFAAKGK